TTRNWRQYDGRDALDSPRPILDNASRGLSASARFRHMSHAELAKTIDDAFERRDRIGPSTKGAVREAVEAALDLLDRGVSRVAERGANGDWRGHPRAQNAA